MEWLPDDMIVPDLSLICLKNIFKDFFIDIDGQTDQWIDKPMDG